jgi:hypothetical protein
MTSRLSVEVRAFAQVRLVAVVQTEIRRGARMAWGRRAPVLLILERGAERRAFTPDGAEIPRADLVRRFPKAANALQSHGETP